MKSQDLSVVIVKERSSFYETLPYFIENHTPYKILPYAFSKEVLDVINASLKSLKEGINSFCVPYEEKSKRYDYTVSITPLVGPAAKFIDNLFYYDNLIDKRCIERWFATSGRQFTRMLKDLMIKTAKEFGSESSSGLFCLLVLLQYFNLRKTEFSSINLGKVAPERKELYFSNFFFFLLELVIDLYIDEIKDDKAFDSINLKFLSPAILYENKYIFLRNPFNYWHVTKTLFDLLEDTKFYDCFSNGEVNITNDVKREAVFASKVKKVRELMYDFITKNYVEDEFMLNLISIFYTPSIFFNFFKNVEDRNRFFDLKKRSKLYQLKKGLLNTFQEQIEDILKLNSKDDNVDMVQDALNCYVTYKNHETYAMYIKSMLQALRDRGSDDSANLKKEYEAGKLYYFSVDNNPIIKLAEKQNSAAIFIDIREFSKKTFHLKEESIIELLKEKFYLPILRYASTRKEQGELKLANIVGDAVIFLGSIEEIIKLSLQAKRHLTDYKRGLGHLIEDDEKKEIMALDIGVFISYGKKPVLTSINTDFGVNTFAVGEIINEASRGAKRELNAFNKLQYVLFSEMKKKGIRLRLPFDVNIVEGYELSIPPTVEFNLLKLEQESEIREAMKDFFEQAKTEMFVKSELADRIWKKRKYIYNVGIGISADALNAFIEAQKLFSDIKKAKISINTFNDETKKQFYFKNNLLELVYIKNRKTGEKYIFRKEAAINFRGIYHETEVWELLTEHLEIYPQILRILEAYQPAH